MDGILRPVMIVVLAFTSCGKDEGDFIDQTEKGVIMADGLIWATRNVGESGKFVAKPENYGGYFTQEEAKTACPEGWRLPTTSEFSTIRDNHDGWTILDGVRGYWFGNLYNDNKIFLPATGFISADGSVIEQGTQGAYWSSSTSGGYNERLYFIDDHVGLGNDSDYVYGFSVRCVSKEYGEL